MKRLSTFVWIVALTTVMSCESPISTPDENPPPDPDDSLVYMLAFRDVKDGETRIGVCLDDGTDYRILGDGNRQYGDAQPSWSPTGNLLACVGAGVPFIVNAYTGQGLGLRVPGNSFVATDYYASWSPTGEHVAFLGVSPQHLAIFDSSGAYERLITFSTFHSGVGVLWSPLGDRIAFVTDSCIYLVDRQGTVIDSLLDKGKMVAWSKDASEIVVRRDQTANRPTTYVVITLVTRAERTLFTRTSSPYENGYSPATLNTIVMPGSHAIDQYDISTGKLTRTLIARLATHCSLSMNGKRITYTSWERGGYGEINVVRTDGRGDTLIRIDANQSSWSPVPARKK